MGLTNIRELMKLVRLFSASLRLGGLTRLYIPKSPIALLIIDDRFEDLRPTKIGKQRRSHVDLAVCELPEQKI